MCLEKTLKSTSFLRELMTTSMFYKLNIFSQIRSLKKGERKLIKLIFLLHYHEDNANVLKQLTVVYALREKTWCEKCLWKAFTDNIMNGSPS